MLSIFCQCVLYTDCAPDRRKAKIKTKTSLERTSCKNLISHALLNINKGIGNSDLIKTERSFLVNYAIPCIQYHMITSLITHRGFANSEALRKISHNKREYS